MKQKILTLLVTFLTIASFAQVKEFPKAELTSNPFAAPDDTSRGYYGKDDRQRINEVGWTKDYARATAISIKKSSIKNNRVWAPTLRQELTAKWKTKKFDSNVRFLDEPLVGNCTGFLIAPDILVTAGHCIYDSDGNDNADEYLWYFGFTDGRDYNQSTGYLTLDPDNIYEVEKVMDGMYEAYYKLSSEGKYVIDEQGKKEIDYYDYAYMKLKRKSDRKPYRFRTGNKVSMYTQMFTIGSPTGLPLKLADNAYVVENDEEPWFKTNIDGFPGNSGGPVFDRLGFIEGIHVRGSRTYSEEKDKWVGDYIYDASCKCVKTVAWESATKQSSDEEMILGSQEHRIGYMKKPIILREALYSNLEYAIEKKNNKRFDFWMIYNWLPNTSYAEERGRLEFVAAKANNLYALKKLISATGKANEVDSKGRSLLFYAIDKNNSEMLKYLLSKGVSPNKKDKNGTTPLRYALSNYKSEMAKGLINKGASVIATDDYGNTALHIAAKYGYMNLVELLVAKGAPLTTKNNKGYTPRKVAAKAKNKDIKKYLKKAEKGKL